MSTEVLLKVEGVSKKFTSSIKKTMRYGLVDIARKLIGQKSSNNHLRQDEFWAVQDISFEVKRGECVGLVGPNGSGKSTLLKMLNGIIIPDQGKIEIHGRAGALIEVGAGFHPLLSGRENIYINGSIMGLSQKEIQANFDSIVEFAELGKFIDAPVSYYSSGMYVRLGFAIAAHLKPDVLVIDEVLAVGDIGFRSKCYSRISEMLKDCAVVFVSHQMPLISKLCNTILVLKEGRNIFAGNTQEGIEKYNNLFSDKETVIAGTGEATLKNIKLFNRNDEDTTSFNYHDPLRITFDLEVSPLYDDYIVSMAFMSKDTTVVAQCHSQYNCVKLKNSKGQNSLSVSIPHLLLNPGKYYFNVIISNTEETRQLTWHFAAKKITVQGLFFGSAPVQFKADWEQVL